MNVALHPPAGRQSINIISLCTGGGGLDLAVELAVPDARTVCMVEREGFACGALVSAMEAGLMAPAPVWSDARTFNGRPWRGLVDGLIGGIPCQPHSLAGKRRGQEDERDLWSVARRIIVQSGAWFVLIENVRGMLSSGGAERVWRDFQRLGFAVEGGLFTAAEVGAPHERERLFILAVADRHGERGAARVSGSKRPNEARDAGKSINSGRFVGNATGAGREGCQPVGPVRSRNEGGAAERSGSTVDDASFARGGQLSVQSRRQIQARGHADGPSHQMEGNGSYLFPPGPQDFDGWRAALASAPELEPAFRRVADGLATRLDIARVDRLRLLGNGVVPLEGAYAFSTLSARLAARGSACAARLRAMSGVAA